LIAKAVDEEAVKVEAPKQEEPITKSFEAETEVIEENQDDAGFIEKKKRGADRNQENRKASARNSSRQSNFRSSNGKPGFPRRTYKKSESSEAGKGETQVKTFDERFSEETAKYSDKYKGEFWMLLNEIF
jgi:hypothetical protein